ncbi:MAG: tRNA (adenosine(37)-N6)-dimethylallyltransferase MiaA [Candidatus Hydrogenedentes bacterium]|nr:tRNA (adenosine(37)-N6)-dimethylallyltransferase MiaA [Candidatus Hydrogenedentota bacterium]
MPSFDSLLILGPTASGKTALGVSLARLLGGEIISADSRQVYRGLDIGSGKDLQEFVVGGAPVAHHLIDHVDLESEYNVFQYQRDFHNAFAAVTKKGHMPIVVGGTGLYLEAILSKTLMVTVPENPELRAEIAPMSTELLQEKLLQLRPDVHNTTDLVDRDRLERAIEIAVHLETAVPEPAPVICPLVLGVEWDRKTLRQRIAHRLQSRIEAGLIEEVEDLLAQGCPWQRLEQLGLEYRHVARYLRGKINNKNDLRQKLSGEICRFAKRQETWFRRMERNGTTIHWIPEGRLDAAMAVIRDAE